MKTASVSYKNVVNGSNILKPNYHLNYGKNRIETAIKNNMQFSTLGEITSDVYTGGIFKRMFIEDERYGLPYISAQHMMNSNPREFAKLISQKYTPRQEDMTLKESQILVSCAGTIGNVRIIDKDLEGIIGSQDIIRVISNNLKVPYGFIYAYLASPTAYNYMQSFIYGSVVPRIDPKTLSKLPVPKISASKTEKIHNLIVAASTLRVNSNKLLKNAQFKLKSYANLKDLKIEDYEFFGNQNNSREVSFFKRNINEITSVSINAFNYSKKIEKLEEIVKSGKYLSLSDCLDSNQFFSTGSFQRLELTSKTSIKLINQSDIFEIKKQGKMLARKFVKADKLVEYGEVIIASVGTLGESESFCRSIFANEELEGQLISGEFIRMKTNEKIPSGYLYCWLSSDYGFRFIRKTQSGTKLCRPIQKLLEMLPVPLLENELMTEIDKEVKLAHTWLFEAYSHETEAIDLIEKEIESWQKS